MKGYCLLPIISLLFFVQSAGAAVVNESRSRLRCFDCHANLPLETVKLTFHEATSVVCGNCHAIMPCGSKEEKESWFMHPLDVVPKIAVPRDMYLDLKGKITCITCHPYHNLHDEGIEKSTKVLRRSSGVMFCYSCHEKL